MDHWAATGIDLTNKATNEQSDFTESNTPVQGPLLLTIQHEVLQCVVLLLVQDVGSKEGENRQLRRRRRPRCHVVVPAASDAALDGICFHRLHGVEKDSAAAA